MLDADGSLLDRTRMIHITDYDCFHEQGYYSPGDTGAPVYTTQVAQIGVAICYGRHYPETMRALAFNGAELVVVPQAGAVAEWPEGLYEAEMRGRHFNLELDLAMFVALATPLHGLSVRVTLMEPGILALRLWATAALPLLLCPLAPRTRERTTREPAASGAGHGRKIMISVVVPLLNEEAIVSRLHDALVTALRAVDSTWEVVYVDDGSRDRTLELLLGLREQDERVVVVELSRNWGHQAALTAGLTQARGDAVVLMDGDLQDPPQVIADMVTAWRKGAQVVLAERRSRAERGPRRWLFQNFYKVLAFLSDFPIPLNVGIFGLLDRQVVDALNQLSETNRYLPGLRAWVGFKTAVVTYDRAERAAGEPKQTVWRLFRYGLNAIFSFSYKPLRLSLFFGMFIATLAMIYGVALLTCRLLGLGMFGLRVVDGYTTTIVSILFLGGVQLMSVGILGEYIGRIYDEVKRRPLVLVRKVHDARGQP